MRCHDPVIVNAAFVSVFFQSIDLLGEFIQVQPRFTYVVIESFSLLLECVLGVVLQVVVRVIVKGLHLVAPVLDVLGQLGLVRLVGFDCGAEGVCLPFYVSHALCNPLVCFLKECLDDSPLIESHTLATCHLLEIVVLPLDQSRNFLLTLVQVSQVRQPHGSSMLSKHGLGNVSGVAQVAVVVGKSALQRIEGAIAESLVIEAIERLGVSQCVAGGLGGDCRDYSSHEGNLE